MMNKLFFGIIFGVFLLASASACSCIYLETAQDKMENADYVFTGKIVEFENMESYPAQYRATFEVYEYWKGDGQLNVVNSVQDTGANCGYNFENGEEYLVYAYKDEDGKLQTNSCSGTQVLAEAWQDLEELGDGTIVDDADDSDDNQDDTDDSGFFGKFWNWFKNLF